MNTNLNVEKLTIGKDGQHYAYLTVDILGYYTTFNCKIPKETYEKLEVILTETRE